MLFAKQEILRISFNIGKNEMSLNPAKKKNRKALVEGEEFSKEVPVAKKYNDQMRQLITQKLDIPIRSVLTMIESKQLTLMPDFQRRGRWDSKRQSRFIESIIMNVPIPPVFLGEDEYGTYVVLDGRQRLTAISEYLKNTFPLESLEIWSELVDRRFHELGEVQNYILRRFVPAVVILKESSPSTRGESLLSLWRYGTPSTGGNLLKI
jgi:hypothetical protein